MGTKAREATADEAFSAAVDELYAAPFEGFVKVRGELAARLRSAGHAAAAKQVLAARKPTRTAWAINQVARRKPERIAHIVDARAAAMTSQRSGGADEIRDSARRFRDAIGAAVEQARSVLEADGFPLSALQARRLGETLQALAGDDDARKALTAGRLTEDVAVDDPFAGIEAAHSHGPARSPREPAASKDDDEGEARRQEAERARQERQRRIDEARARVADIERDHAAARKVATEADRVLGHAQRDADRAKKALDGVARELEDARAHLETLRDPSSHASSSGSASRR